MNTEVVKSAEYAFIVVKQKDGRYAIANVDNDETERQPTMDDVMAALRTLNADLDRQATAMAVMQFLSQAQGQQGQTPNGLIVPEKRFVKRNK